MRLYHDSSIIKTAIKAERTYLEYVDAFNPIVAALTMLAVCLACSPSGRAQTKLTRDWAAWPIASDWPRKTGAISTRGKGDEQI